MAGLSQNTPNAPLAAMDHLMPFRCGHRYGGIRQNWSQKNIDRLPVGWRLFSAACQFGKRAGQTGPTL